LEDSQKLSRDLATNKVKVIKLCLINIVVYVDDIIVTGNDEKEKEKLKHRLVNEFEVKELGRLKYLSGIELAYSNQGIFISQQKYITHLLEENEKIRCRPVSTPMDPNHKLCKAEEESIVDKKMYQRMIGKLIYLAHKQPDIAISVSVIGRFMHEPKECRLQAVYRILHYLKGNLGKKILFKINGRPTLEAYTDVDYVGFLVDRRSTIEYCTFLGEN